MSSFATKSINNSPRTPATPFPGKTRSGSRLFLLKPVADPTNGSGGGGDDSAMPKSEAGGGGSLPDASVKAEIIKVRTIWQVTTNHRVTKVLGDKFSIQGQSNNHSGPESRVCPPPRVLLSPCRYVKRQSIVQEILKILTAHNKPNPLLITSE